MLKKIHSEFVKDLNYSGSRESIQGVVKGMRFRRIERRTMVLVINFQDHTVVTVMLVTILMHDLVMFLK